jgi:hypothetical protein
VLDSSLQGCPHAVKDMSVSRNFLERRENPGQVSPYSGDPDVIQTCGLQVSDYLVVNNLQVPDHLGVNDLQVPDHG